MRSSVVIGFVGGIVIGALQFLSIMRSMNFDAGTWDMLLFYSPQIAYFMCLYMSVKIYARNQDSVVPEFKGCLKAGGITMLIIVLFWFVSIFVAFTHTDINALAQYSIAHGNKENLSLILGNYSQQGIFDHAKFMTLPNVLLGFAIIVLVTVIVRVRGNKA